MVSDTQGSCHIVSVVKKQRELKPSAQLTVSFSLVKGLQVLLTIKLRLPISINFIDNPSQTCSEANIVQITLHRFAWRMVFFMIPDSIKLTIQNICLLLQ